MVRRAKSMSSKNQGNERPNPATQGSSEGRRRVETSRKFVEQHPTQVPGAINSDHYRESLGYKAPNASAHDSQS